MGYRRRRYRASRQNERVVWRETARGLLNQRFPGTKQVDIVRRANAFTTHDAHPDAGIVDVPLGGDQVAMPGITIRCSKTAVGVHHADIEEFRYGDPLDQRALPREHLERTLESPRHLVVELVECNRCRHCQAHPLHRARLQRKHRLVGQYRIEHGATSYGTRQRPEAVERRRKGHTTLQRDAPLRRLEADNAIIRSWYPA